MTRRAILLQASVLLVMALSACYDSRDGPYRPAIVAQADGPVDGGELYLRDCGWCHGAQGEGTQRGPDLRSGTNGPALTHFTLTTGRMPLDSPDEPMRRRQPIYDSDEIDAIVSYMSTFDQAGPPIPVVDLEAAELSLGGELYQENCAACHSTSGIGGALASGDTAELRGAGAESKPNIASDLHASTPTEIAEAMLTGPGTMPVFGRETLSDEEIDAIVRYVVYLQHPNNRGGFGGGGIGPVAEGAFGWLLGLGALLVFIRWLGTRTGEK
jgi:ubiquinol-cytochrome c reductase cytochrome c subunit